MICRNTNRSIEVTRTGSLRPPHILSNLDSLCNGIMCHESRFKVISPRTKKKSQLLVTLLLYFIFILPTRTCHEKKIQEEMI